MSPDPKFVEVYRARNLPEAHTIRIKLEEMGIPVQLDGELLQGVIGELPMGWVTAPRILVEQAHVDAALDIIQPVDARDRAGPYQPGGATRCLACGQVLPKIESACPSCGWDYEVDVEISPDVKVAEPAPNQEGVAPKPVTQPWSRTRGWIIAIVSVLGLASVLVFRIVTATEGDYQRGLAAFDGKNYDLAIACFSKVIRWEPGNTNAYRYRGAACRKKGEYDLAIADYSYAIQLDPRDALTYVSRGNVFLVKGDVDKAIADFDEAIVIDPRDEIAYFSRGTAFNDKGNYDRAIEDYLKAIRLNPTNPNPYYGLACLSATCPDAKKRNGQRAVEYAQRAQELSHGNDDVLDILAAAYAEKGDFDAAVKWQQKALDSPGFAKTANEKVRAEARRRLQLYQERKPYRDE